MLPESDLITQWFLETYDILARSRTSNGFGLNPLSLTDIITILSIRESVYDIEFTLKLIQSLDYEFLIFQQEESKREEDKKEAEKNRKPQFKKNNPATTLKRPNK